MVAGEKAVLATYFENYFSARAGVLCKAGGLRFCLRRYAVLDKTTKKCYSDFRKITKILIGSGYFA